MEGWLAVDPGIRGGGRECGACVFAGEVSRGRGEGVVRGLRPRGFLSNPLEGLVSPVSTEKRRHLPLVAQASSLVRGSRTSEDACATAPEPRYRATTHLTIVIST